MIRKVFAIFDSKGKVFSNPYFFNEEGEILREFIDLANDPQSKVNKHPEDYILFKIGSYDDTTGSLEAVIPPLNLGVASAYIRVSQAPLPINPALVDSVQLTNGGKQ